ncbi:MAG: hypothetical protein A2066_14950 [Bacteroidetes bacterium GWB2_41_8]|nr:MAG: hypothetical protein A2066_14950 [Bacteroidetes bacterium GWB2_41_8]
MENTQNPNNVEIMNGKPVINLKKEYEKFVSETSRYYERMAAFNNPEYMTSQYKDRLNILGNVSELCCIFTINSVHILDAFKDHRDYMQKNGFKNNTFFDDLTNCMIKLISEKEELYKWIDQLSRENKYLDENKVFDMSIEDINNL